MTITDDTRFHSSIKVERLPSVGARLLEVRDSIGEFALYVTSDGMVQLSHDGAIVAESAGRLRAGRWALVHATKGGKVFVTDYLIDHLLPYVEAMRGLEEPWCEPHPRCKIRDHSGLRFCIDCAALSANDARGLT